MVLKVILSNGDWPAEIGMIYQEAHGQIHGSMSEDFNPEHRTNGESEATADMDNTAHGHIRQVLQH
jgi:hypothetical protein